MTKNEKIKWHLQKSMETSALWAQYHIARATTGACKKDIVHHGLSDGPLFTEDELVERALGFAKNHICAYQKYVDQYLELE